MTNEGAIVQAGPGHWAELGEVIGQAFATDPVASWTMGSTAAISATFAWLAHVVYLPRGTCHLIPKLGGTMWLAEGQSKDMGLFPTLAAGWPLLRLGGVRHPWRALMVDAGMKRRRPTTPHMYLFAVGVTEPARGRGIGRRLLAPMLAESDRAGLPAYLENSKDRNMSFYESVGFRASGPKFSPAHGCPNLLPMWREPRC